MRKRATTAKTRTCADCDIPDNEQGEDRHREQEGKESPDKDDDVEAPILRPQDISIGANDVYS